LLKLRELRQLLAMRKRLADEAQQRLLHSHETEAARRVQDDLAVQRLLVEEFTRDGDAAAAAECAEKVAYLVRAAEMYAREAEQARASSVAQFSAALAAQEARAYAALRAYTEAHHGAVWVMVSDEDAWGERGWTDAVLRAQARAWRAAEVEEAAAQ
jgi:hypothetical protein